MFTALVHFRTLVTRQRVRIRVRVGLELRLGLELELGLGLGVPVKSVTNHIGDKSIQ